MEIIVNHVYYDINKKRILDDIYIEFEKNSISGIIGASGKTTLLNLVMGIIEPTYGNIKIGKHYIEKDFDKKLLKDIRFNIGLVSQNASSRFICKTVKEELELPLKCFNYRLKEMDKRVKDSLKMVGLSEEYLNMNIKDLSSGELHKLSLAVALIFNPKNLLLDEPIIGLDDNDRKELIRLIKILKLKYNKTIIIASNNTDFLHKLVDKVYILYNGRIILSGNKYDVFKQVRLLKKYNVIAPKIMEFSDRVLNKKQVKIGYRDEINDLIKDVYRYAK